MWVGFVAGCPVAPAAVLLGAGRVVSYSVVVSRCTYLALVYLGRLPHLRSKDPAAGFVLLTRCIRGAEEVYRQLSARNQHTARRPLVWDVGKEHFAGVEQRVCSGYVCRAGRASALL